MNIPKWDGEEAKGQWFDVTRYNFHTEECYMYITDGDHRVFAERLKRGGYEIICHKLRIRETVYVKDMEECMAVALVMARMA